MALREVEKNRWTDDPKPKRMTASTTDKEVRKPGLKQESEPIWGHMDWVGIGTFKRDSHPDMTKSAS